MPGVPMRPFFSLFLVLIAACAGGDGEPEEDTRTPLTCDTLADDGFCWNVGVAEAYACIDETAASGTFDATREVCTLSDGTTVVFDTPVPADPSADAADDYPWTFTVHAPAGGQCMRFEDNDTDGFVLTTASGTTTERLVGFTGVEIECPDGELFYNGNAFDLFECEQEITLPGYAFAGNVSWQLLGGPEGRFSLFECQ